MKDISILILLVPVIAGIVYVVIEWNKERKK
jgi:hypothetical protein